MSLQSQTHDNCTWYHIYHETKTHISTLETCNQKHTDTLTHHTFTTTLAPPKNKEYAHTYTTRTQAVLPHSDEDPTLQHCITHHYTNITRHTPWRQTHSQAPNHTWSHHKATRTQSEPRPSARYRLHEQTRSSGHAPSPPRTPRPLTFCLPSVASGSQRS